MPAGAAPSPRTEFARVAALSHRGPRSYNSGMAPHHCRIEAPARVHLGFIDLNGDFGRQFGSIGVAIEGFDTVILAEPHAELRVSGAQAERAEGYVRRLLQALGETRGVNLHVEHAAPPHVGLGSGTQLALAVAAAVSGALGLAADPRELATLVGRGQRSGIGLAVFAQGGFIVDGGRGPATVVPPVIARLEFPSAWRAVLVFDAAATGLHGAAERAAFATLPPMAEAVAARLSRHCLVGLLPAVAEQDFAGFCTHLAAVQREIGSYFAPAQGAPVVSPRVAAALVLAAREFGLTGCGQTSWGPTGFVFAPDFATAQRYTEALAGDPAAAGTTTSIVQACNHGAVSEGALPALRRVPLRTSNSRIPS